MMKTELHAQKAHHPQRGTVSDQPEISPVALEDPGATATDHKSVASDYHTQPRCHSSPKPRGKHLQT